MVRRREREDYAPEEKEPWEKREEQYERERKKKDKPKKKKEEPWEKREEQRERKRRKEDKKPKEKKPKDRYEEFEDYEKRAKVEPVKEYVEPIPTRREPTEPIDYTPYAPFFEGDIEDPQFRRYAIQQARGYVPTQPREYQPGIIDRWLVEEERAFGGISKRLWGEAEKVRPASKPLLFEEQAYRMRKREIPDIGTLFARAKYGGIHLGAGFIEGVSFPARPLAWGKTSKGIYGLITSKEKRREFGRAYRERPGAYGLQFLGGLGGGYVSGKGLSLLSRKVGLTKPRTYRLKQVTVSRPSETPATLMPKGRWGADTSLWRKGKPWSPKVGSKLFWIGQRTAGRAAKYEELLKKGGTPALILKDKPDLMLIHKPVPVYRPSIFEPGFGIIGGISAITKERTEAPERLEPGPQIPAGYLDIIQRMKPQKGRFRQRTEEAMILKPVSWTKQEPLPWVEPGYRRKQRRRQKTTPIPIPIMSPKQEQVQRQRPLLAPVQIPMLRVQARRKTSLRLPFEEKKKKRRRRDLLFGFEQRRYAVQTEKELKRLIG